MRRGPTPHSAHKRNIIYTRHEIRKFPAAFFVGRRAVRDAMTAARTARGDAGTGRSASGLVGDLLLEALEEGVEGHGALLAVGAAADGDLAGRGLLRYRAVRWAVYYALLFAVAYWGGAQSEFIYFQF